MHSTVSINTKQNLQELIANNPDKTIVLKFSANWCKPCKTLAEWLDKQTLPSNVILAHVDISEGEADELCKDYHVMNIPTLVKIGEADNDFTKVVGFSIEHIKSLLNL